MLWRGRRSYHQEFWALRDISFEVGQGETVGIVGANGSGKSTLLQIITGTLAATTGGVKTEGRISALLELGSGFNPEFTGIENARMNAALLGISRDEIDALMPAIEAFAEIGAFLHQPVKTYSSGMYVRLAFAVAVAVDPEILIVDEALAVGDAVFQHRCQRRIRQMRERGATVLFVSHDAAAVRALCSRAILLDRGRMIAEGKPSDVFNRYQRIVMSRERDYDEQVMEAAETTGACLTIDAGADAPAAPANYAYRHGDGAARVVGIDLCGADSRPAGTIESGEDVTVRVRFRCERALEIPVCGILIRDRHGIHVYGTNTLMQRADADAAHAGDELEAAFRFNCRLAPGQFSITIAVHSPDGISYDWIDGALFFRVVSRDEMDGIVNLDAEVSLRRVTHTPSRAGDEAARDAHVVGA